MPRPPPPTPPPEVDPTTTPGRSASLYTDPHVRTYDGLNYDCMASGEFIVAQSEGAKFEVQARFVGPDVQGSVTKGVAALLGSSPPVSFVIAQSASSAGRTVIRDCPVLFYVSSRVRNLFSGSGQSAVKVVATSDGAISVEYPNGITVQFSVQTSSFFGCYFESVNVFLPEAFVRANQVIGLLGSPNGNIQDEWMTRMGVPLPLPESTNERLYAAAYNYCTTNWCIKERSESLFSYEPGTSFESISARCDVVYRGPPNLSSASSALQTLCGEDTACLIDGIIGGIEDARNALTVQADVDRRASVSLPLRFSPPLVQVGQPTNILVTIDVSASAASDRQNLDRFLLFGVNRETGALFPQTLLELEDNGQAAFSDATAGDLIFSNILALESSRGGEVFAFRAVPVINGQRTDSSPLAVTARSAIRSYSTESGVGSESAGSVSATVPNLTGLELVVRYSWPLNEVDLDTGTEFLGQKVGFDCGTSPYMQFSGDNTSSGGSETVTVRLAQARADGKWKDDTVVNFNAGWFSREGGPATVRTFLQNASTKEEVSGTGLATVITPGSQNGCSATLVGRITVKVAISGVAFTLTLP